MKSKFLYLIGIMLISGLLVSCDKDSENEKSGDFKKLLIGYWAGTHSQGYYHSFTNPGNNEEWDKDISADGTLCFKEDGTFEDTMYGAIARGNWTLNGNQLSLTITWCEDPESIGGNDSPVILELNESKLVLEFHSKNENYEEYDKSTFIKVNP